MARGNIKQVVTRVVVSAALSGLLAATAPGLVLSASASSDRHEQAVAKRSLPASLTVSTGVRQLITVTSRGWNDTWATLRFWHRKLGGSWRSASPPIRARVGYGGWARAHRRVQSTGTTPAGLFRIRRAFGSLPDPGTRLDYRRFDSNDYWPYEPRDPATYNVYQYSKADRTRWRPDYAEHLWRYRQQYGYAVVIGFNLPSGISYSPKRQQWVAKHRSDTSRGGGIFLHVHNGKATAGCVAINKDSLASILTRLKPARHPRIVMGPRSYVVSAL
ncbi:MAG: L,D-transpeptidase family protein [Nocardioidaceae bacterium]